MDKIGCIPNLPNPTDEDFFIKKPTEKNFNGCCNEFFWCMCDVIKGIARDELPFAMTTYNTLVRNMLELMLSWHIGIITDFSVSSGKLNKYFKKYLPEEFYLEYKNTYTDGDYENFWNGIYTSCKLFHKTALTVSKYFNYVYPQSNEDGFYKYAEFIKQNISI